MRQISSCSEITNTELRLWAESRSRAAVTRMFVATFDDEDIAYVAIDVTGKWDYVVLYELYVLPERRRRGYGTTILKTVEQTVSDLGFSQTVLKPKPIDAGVTRDDLVRWYRKHGYSWFPQDKELMVKRLGGGT